MIHKPRGLARLLYIFQDNSKCYGVYFISNYTAYILKLNSHHPPPPPSLAQLTHRIHITYFWFIRFILLWAYLIAQIVSIGKGFLWYTCVTKQIFLIVFVLSFCMTGYVVKKCACTLLRNEWNILLSKFLKSIQSTKIKLFVLHENVPTYVTCELHELHGINFFFLPIAHVVNSYQFKLTF